MIFISSSDNFLKRVSDIVLDSIKALPDPLHVLQMRVFLPNNRSCRIVKDHLINSKKTLVLPRILTPFEPTSVDNQIREITNVIRVLNNPESSITSKFNLASSLYTEIKNLLQEKLSLDDAISTVANPQIIELVRKLDIHLDTRSIEENIRYLQDTDTPCICAGFTYSHAYLLDFLKAAVQAKKHLIVLQTNPDIYGLSHKLIKYIGADADMPKTATNNSIISIIEPPNKTNEIKTISTIIRKNVGRKIAVIYTDKELMTGVRCYLQKWNINIDDSAGIPYKETHEATVFLLLLQAFIAHFSTNSLLELLKCITEDDYNLDEKTSYDNTGSYSKETTYEKQTIKATSIISYLNGMSTTFFSVSDLKIKLSIFEETFYFILSNIGLSASDTIKNLFQHLDDLLPYISSLSEYYSLAVKLMSMYSARSPLGYTPNIIAIGPLEAQIITSDVTIIAGFNDGNWLENASSYIFNGRDGLSRELEQRRNNDIYNTLYHALKSSKEVFFTNATVSQGTQQKLCRLIYSFLKQDELSEAKNNGLLWTFDESIKTEQTAPPMALAPHLSDRPLAYSVSDIELLMNNPYAFYAKKILKLVPLNDVSDEEYADRLKGILLHNALKDANSQNSDVMQMKIIANVEKEIKRLGLKKYHFLDWSFKLSNIANYAANHAFGASYVEYPGSIELDISGQTVKLKCIADSIFRNGEQISIVDYKTGTIPTYQDILSLCKPQMLIEALIATKNGFYNIRNCEIDRLEYIQLGGTKQSLKTINLRENKAFKDIDEVLQKTEENIKQIIATYTVDLQPFAACEMTYYGEYSHLDREKEWRE